MKETAVRPGMTGVSLIAVLVAGIVMLDGCSSGEELTTLPPEQRFAKGVRLFEEEEYLEAINEFTVITLQDQGSSVADDAQYYLGECRFKREEYLLAAFEYQQLIRNLPASPLVPDAQFRIGLCYYNLSPKSALDQQYTLKAIDELQTFVEYHPGHASAPEADRLIRELTGRLARKSYEVAQQYMVLEYFKAALFYLDDVIDKYHDTEFAPRAYLDKTQVLMTRRKYADALRTVSLFLEKFPESALRTEALQLKAAAEEKLGAAERPASGLSVHRGK